MRAQILRPRGSDSHCLWVTLDGDIDMDCHDGLAALVDAFSRSLRPNIGIDIRGVDFAGSSALRTFSALQAIAARRGGTVTLVGASRPMRKVLAITGEQHKFIVLPDDPLLHAVV